MMDTGEVWRLALAAILGVLAFAGGLWLTNRISAPPAPVAGFSLDRTIADIKLELTRINNDPGPDLGLKLSSVKIELQLRQADEQTSSAGLSVPVFTEAALKAGTLQSSDASSKVTLVLVPPDDRPLLSADAQPKIRFADLLIAARASLAAAMASEPRLDAKSIEVQIAFVLVAQVSGSAEVKAAVLSAGAGAKASTTVGNAVTLTYTNPAYAKTEAAAPQAP